MFVMPAGLAFSCGEGADENNRTVEAAVTGGIGGVADAVIVTSGRAGAVEHGGGQAGITSVDSGVAVVDGSAQEGGSSGGTSGGGGTGVASCPTEPVPPFDPGQPDATSCAEAGVICQYSAGVCCVCNEFAACGQGTFWWCSIPNDSGCPSIPPAAGDPCTLPQNTPCRYCIDGSVGAQLCFDQQWTDRIRFSCT